MLFTSLSTNTKRTILEILETRKEIRDLARFRRSCFEINEIAKENEYDKLNAAEVRIDRVDNSVTVEILAELPLNHKKRSGIWQPDVASLAFSLSARHFESLGSTPTPKVFAIKRPITPADDVTSLLASMLETTFRKVKCIRQLSIFQLNLKKELTESMANYKDIMGTVETLNVKKCEISLTSDELSDFLRTFPNLHNLCLAGAFNEATITDQHLMTAKKHLKISNDFSILQMDGLSGENIFGHWKKYIPKSLTLWNISTKIKFSDLWRFVQTVAENESAISKFEQSKEPIELNFGHMENNEEFHKTLIKMQQLSRGFTWKLDHSKKNMWYQITSHNGSIIVKFTTKHMFNVPNFAEMLVTLVNLTGQVTNAVEPLDLEFENGIRKQLRSMETLMREYEEKFKLPDPQLKPPGLENEKPFLRAFDNIRDMMARMIATAPLNHPLYGADDIYFMDDVILEMQEADGIINLGDRQLLLDNLTRIERIVRLRKSQVEEA